MRMLRCAALILSAILFQSSPSLAQSVRVVTSCGAGQLFPSGSYGGVLVVDVNGNLCTGAILSSSLAAGTNIIGKVGIDQTTDVITNGVEIAPTAGAAAGIIPVVSAVAEASHIFKASAGNLYSAYVTTGVTAGFLMIFNAIAAPADGAVTPVHCLQAPANQTVALNFNPGPAESYSTGITAVFSSTGCFTKTASATAFFHGSVK